MAQKLIQTSITIKSTPQKIWEILTDFDKYPSWNPFITFAEGDFEVGNRVKITAGGMNFKPEVLVVEEGKELRWIGRLFFTGVFDGEHIFKLIDNQDGTVTFKHEEKFNGILVAIFAKKLDSDTKLGFENMNQRLKELAENN